MQQHKATTNTSSSTTIFMKQTMHLQAQLENQIQTLNAARNGLAWIGLQIFVFRQTETHDTRCLTERLRMDAMLLKTKTMAQSMKSLRRANKRCACCPFERKAP
eukprot:TRINITY_DN23226_c0_g1_i1.p1 TRINITY_DN23226_c0_g1~~TRINITY_DN23226_c0_g1_i1.p1  ORF type:complete len:104 (+),score=17.17 TRINITY_DN23226_c0_g1_i1:189-500(+)